MLVIDNNSVYEIDEECVKTRSVPKECQVIEKLRREWQEAAPEKKK